MAFETIDEIYQAVRKQPRDEQLRLAAKILKEAAVDKPSEMRAAKEPALLDNTNLPEWMRFAIEASERIARRAADEGIELPTDLAQNHDFYAHGKRNK